MLMGQSTFYSEKHHSDNGTDVLFIGSSYFNYNNLPSIFENLCSNADQYVYVDSHLHNGWFLDDHANNADTEALINERDWDFVILQGGGSIAYPSYYSDHPVFPALVTLKEKILANCPATKIIYCMPWAFEDGMTWIGWEDTYADMQEIIYDSTLSYANQIGFSIAPVGWAWYEVLDSLNYPLHFLHLSDWNHPSEKGSYLMGCVIYASIFQESVENNAFYYTLPEREVRWFQQVASDVVLNDLELWNLADSIPNGFHKLDLPQISLSIFPNPVKNTSIINYQITKPGHTKLSIINIKGETLRSLNLGYKVEGTFDLFFDFSEYSDGVYFVVFQQNNKRFVKRIILSK
jgi:hypothetical protein